MVLLNDDSTGKSRKERRKSQEFESFSKIYNLLNFQPIKACIGKLNDLPFPKPGLMK